MPITHPVIAPAVVTVRARQPRNAATRLIATAGASRARTIGIARSIDAASTKLTLHNTSAAAAGTEMLSLSRIGAVSMNPAMIAASAGAATSHQRGSAWRSASAHIARPMAPSAPKTMNAINPPADFARFQDSGGVRTCAPTSVAKPSPAASTPHAAAAMSGRAGKASTSASTASG